MTKHLEKIMEDKDNKILIFTGTKRVADDITRFLRQDGWPALCKPVAPSINIKLTSFLAIHGDKQQNERDWVLNEFKTGKSPIMVATDVASSGIGMIETPLPCTATPRRLHSSAFLSTLTQSPDCVNVPGLFRVFWFSFIGCLGSSVKHTSCCTRNSKLKSTSLGTRCGIGIS